MKRVSARLRRNFSKIISIVLLVVILVMVIFLLNDFSARLDRTVERQAETYLTETAVQSADLFDVEMNGIVDMLRLLAAYAATFRTVIAPEVVYMMDSALQEAEFTSIGIGTPDGTFYVVSSVDIDNYGTSEPLHAYENPPETVVDIGGEGYFQTAMRGEVAIAAGAKSFVTDEDVIVVMVPVERNGEVSGVLGIAYNLHVLEDMMNITTFGGEGVTYIIDADGNVVLGSHHPNAMIHEGNIFDVWGGNGDISAVAGQMRGSMQEGKKGYVHVVLEEGERYISYAPTAVNDWYVLSVIPEEVVHNQAAEVSELAMEISVQIILLCAVFMAYISVRQLMSRRELKASHEALTLSEKRYRTVMENASDIVFEWNYRAGVPFFSNRWFDYFEPPPDQGSSLLLTENLERVHPEDRVVFVKYVLSQRTGQPMNEVEFRLRSKRGEYIWLRVRSTMIWDRNGEKESLVGTIADISKEYEERRRLILRSQTDSLTGFFNKVSGEELVGSYLELAATDSFAAFMMIDFDYFKEINDKEGHPYGDRVLLEMAKGMKQLFRKTDILIRLGGDEIGVFVKNIGGVNAAIDKAAEVIDLFHAFSRSEKRDVKISCSIGIAFYPKDGRDYATLYAKADVALYEAKEKGRGRFVVYHPRMGAAARERMELLRLLEEDRHEQADD